MALKIDAKFEGKLTCASKNDMRNLVNFHQRLLWEPFIQSRKCMNLKFTGELCVMTTKNDEKFEKKLICQFKIAMRNLTSFYPSTRKSYKFAL